MTVLEPKIIVQTPHHAQSFFDHIQRNSCDEYAQDTSGMHATSTMSMMIGISGSGKTTHVKNNLYDYAHISLDINRMRMSGAQRGALLSRYMQEDPMRLGLHVPGMPQNPAGRQYAASLSSAQDSNSRRAQYIQINDALKSGKSVVIDDTNLTREIRWPYIRLARLHHIAIHAVSFLNITRAFEQNSKRDGTRTCA